METLEGGSMWEQPADRTAGNAGGRSGMPAGPIPRHLCTCILAAQRHDDSCSFGGAAGSSAVAALLPQQQQVVPHPPPQAQQQVRFAFCLTAIVVGSGFEGSVEGNGIPTMPTKWPSSAPTAARM
jgi:hypothetical protein